MSKFITCPHCKQHTDPTVPYCSNCGKKITLDSEQYTKGLKKKITSEREGELLSFLRGIMVLVVFIFIASVIFAFSLASEPVLDIQPAYPLISPDEETITDYNLSDKVNSVVADTVGIPLSDYDYVTDEIEMKKFIDKHKSDENSKAIDDDR